MSRSFVYQSIVLVITINKTFNSLHLLEQCVCVAIILCVCIEIPNKVVDCSQISKLYTINSSFQA